MPLPNFFIIGASKAGTTSLYFYLKEHPEVYMSPFKEPKFFAYDPSNAEHRGDEKTFPFTTMEAYRRLFSGVSNEKAIGEASVGYLHNETARTAIKAHIPDAKIIVSLRNPVDRAASVYLQNTRRRGELRAVHEAFQTSEGWVRSGLYYESVRDYMGDFGRSRVKVLLFDDLKANSLRVMKDVYDFLEVDEEFNPDVSVHHNPGRVTQSETIRKLDQLYIKSPRLSLMAHTLLPYRLRRRLAMLGRKNVEVGTLLPDDDRHRMADFYHEDILKLQDLVRIDLTGWLDENGRDQSAGDAAPIPSR